MIQRECHNVQKVNSFWSLSNSATGPSTRVLHSLVSKIRQCPQLTSHCMRLRAFLMGLLKYVPKLLLIILMMLKKLQDIYGFIFVGYLLFVFSLRALEFWLSHLQSQKGENSLLLYFRKMFCHTRSVANINKTSLITASVDSC